MRGEPAAQFDRHRHLPGRQRLIGQIGPQRDRHLEGGGGDLGVDAPSARAVPENEAVCQRGAVDQFGAAAQHAARCGQDDIAGVEAASVGGQRAGSVKPGERQAGVDQVDDPLTAFAGAALQVAGHDVIVEEHRGGPKPSGHVAALDADAVDRDGPLARDEIRLACAQVVDILRLQRLAMIDTGPADGGAFGFKSQRCGVFLRGAGDAGERDVERRLCRQSQPADMRRPRRRDW